MRYWIYYILDRQEFSYNFPAESIRNTLFDELAKSKKDNNCYFMIKGEIIDPSKISKIWKITKEI